MAADINYMTELKAMYGFFMTKSPGKAAVAMLQALYMVNNAEHWADWFEVDCDGLSRLMGGYSRDTICEARTKLLRMGRIEYKAGDRNCQKASYKIIPFAKTTAKQNVALSAENVVTDNADLFPENINSDMKPDMKVDMKPDMKSKPSYLYNKTKQNKTARSRDPISSLTSNPFFDALVNQGFDI